MLADSIRAIVDEFNAAALRDLWTASTEFAVAQQRVAGGRYWTCKTAGISAASGAGPELVYTTGTPPVIDAVASANVVDGTAVWSDAGAASGTHTAPVPSFVGEKYEAEHGTPPRLVWVPTDDTFGPPVKTGASGGVNPKSVRTRLAGVDCHIWAADLAAAEQIINDLVFAAHKALKHGWYEPQAGHWKTAGELQNQGIGYVLPFILQIPIVGTAAASVTLLTYVTTTTIDEVTS